MGRRSDHSREELRALLLSAAEGLVAEEGLEALTARRLAKRAGYSVGTIYNLFADMRELMLHLNGELVDQMGEYLEGARTLGTLCQRYITFARENLFRWRLLFEYTSDEPLPVWFEEKVAKALGLAEEKIRAEWGATAKEAKLTARMLWASLHGICLLELGGKLASTGSESATTLANELVDRLAKSYE